MNKTITLGAWCAMENENFDSKRKQIYSEIRTKTYDVRSSLVSSYFFADTTERGKREFDTLPEGSKLLLLAAMSDPENFSWLDVWDHSMYEDMADWKLDVFCVCIDEPDVEDVLLIHKGLNQLRDAVKYQDLALLLIFARAIMLDHPLVSEYGSWRMRVERILQEQRERVAQWRCDGKKINR